MEKSQVQTTRGKTPLVGGGAGKILTVVAITALTVGGSALSAGYTGKDARPPHATQDFSTHRTTQYPALAANSGSAQRAGDIQVRNGGAVAAASAKSGSNSSTLGRRLHQLKPGSALHCLTMNIYWEARNQEIAGQLAVAQVTLNRVRDSRYPNDICEVVYDHKQFSWYWDGKSDTPNEPHAWETALMIASAAMDGSGHAELQGVTHYHAVYIQPYWKDYMTMVAMIGDHIFYAD
jgi:spore germination cell wall hydrolase CwlJ-like protein